MNGSNQHDHAVDELLRRVAAAVPGETARTPACLDEETLASWFDDSLTPGERAAAESHLAGCSRCQAVVAAMARMEPAAAGTAARVVPLARGRMRWFVPAAAAAAVAGLAVWVAVGNRPSPADVADTMARVETSRSVPSPQSAPPPLAAPPAAGSPAPGAQGAEPAIGNGAQVLRQEAAPAAISPTPGAASPPEQSAPARKAEESERREVQERDRAADQSPAAEPQRQPQGALADQTAAMPRVEAVPAAPRPAAQTAAAPTPGAPPPAAQPQTRAFAVEPMTAPAVVSSPDGSTRWRLAGGTIERSPDGVNWSSAYAGTVRLAAVSAPSASVCWVVGERGIVLRSTDGRTFVLVTAPAAANLTRVSASDALSASVETADGRTFRTADGGTTWTAVR